MAVLRRMKATITFSNECVPIRTQLTEQEKEAFGSLEDVAVKFWRTL